MEKGKLQVIPLGNGYAWFDTGSPDRLSDASDFVKAIELRQGVQIACLEEIAYRNEWISKDTLLEYANKYKKTEYGKYLKRIAEQDWDTYKEIYNSELFNNSKQKLKKAFEEYLLNLKYFISALFFYQKTTMRL